MLQANAGIMIDHNVHSSSIVGDETEHIMSHYLNLQISNRLVHLVVLLYVRL